MKACGAEKNFHEIIARNVEGGADSAPPPGPFRVNTVEQTKSSYNEVILLVLALYISLFFYPDIMRNLI